MFSLCLLLNRSKVADYQLDTSCEFLLSSFSSNFHFCSDLSSFNILVTTLWIFLSIISWCLPRAILPRMLGYTSGLWWFSVVSGLWPIPLLFNISVSSWITSLLFWDHIYNIVDEVNIQWEVTTSTAKNGKFLHMTSDSNEPYPCHQDIPYKIEIHCLFWILVNDSISSNHFVK